MAWLSMARPLPRQERFDGAVQSGERAARFAAFRPGPAPPGHPRGGTLAEKEVEEVYVIIRRKLKDYERWKKVVSELDGTRRKYGSKGGTVYRAAKDPNDVILVFEWDDSKPYRRYFELPEVQKALDETGTTEIVEVRESFHLGE
jgi:heme-degrading monooxygenase HmoA